MNQAESSHERLRKAWLKRLETLYTPEGAVIWLDNPHRILGGRSAWSCILAGETTLIESLVAQLEDGAAT